jgi:hypothetical protein
MNCSGCCLSASRNERTVCDTLRSLGKTQVQHDHRLPNGATNFSAPASPYCSCHPKALDFSFSTLPP